MPTNPSHQLILVSGIPGAGKSTIARRLADASNLPLLDRDDIKDTLLNTLGWKDRAWSQYLGRASWELMFLLIDRLLTGGASIIADTNFTIYNAPNLQPIRGKTPRSTWTEIFCTAELRTCASRMAQRHLSGNRHPGHNPEAKGTDDYLPGLESRTWEPTGVADVTYRIDTTDDAQPDLSEILANLGP